MRRLIAVPALLVALAATGCAHGPRSTSGGDRVEIGEASFYGPGFEGRRTASGAIFDPEAMTCAHRTHPFGTRLRVTNLSNERSVKVTVTDRGPYARRRVIDVSLAAARRLGFVEKGHAKVKVERLE